MVVNRRKYWSFRLIVLQEDIVIWIPLYRLIQGTETLNLFSIALDRLHDLKQSLTILLVSLEGVSELPRLLLDALQAGSTADDDPSKTPLL